MSNKYFSFIKNLRVEKNLSQIKIAKELGISRSSYIAFEQGKRDLFLHEAGKLSKIFQISLEEIQQGKLMPTEFVLNKKAEKESPAVKQYKISSGAGISMGTGVAKVLKDEPYYRISEPQEYVDKFKQILLYILSKIGGKPNIGQTVLYKILYFIDFDYYEKYMEQLIGARYIKNTHGPTPIIFPKIIKELEKEGKIETIKSKFYKYDQTKYLINPETKIDLTGLSAQDLAHIDWELQRLSDLTAVQISDLSHKDTPWLVAKDKAVLEYEFSFYRPDETSVYIDNDPL
ncbi:MAG: type II toxin-antitoxin system antitoxin SocA domain-containing protein [bacterium]